MLRTAMGDFASINSFETYDIIADPDLEGDAKYKHSLVIVIFTWIMFVLNTFVLFMVFMNFIIAVIGESYSKVRSNKEAHDYK